MLACETTHWPSNSAWRYFSVRAHLARVGVRVWLGFLTFNPTFRRMRTPLRRHSRYYGGTYCGGTINKYRHSQYSHSKYSMCALASAAAVVAATPGARHDVRYLVRVRVRVGWPGGIESGSPSPVQRDAPR